MSEREGFLLLGLDRSMAPHPTPPHRAPGSRPGREQLPSVVVDWGGWAGAGCLLLMGPIDAPRRHHSSLLPFPSLGDVRMG